LSAVTGTAASRAVVADSVCVDTTNLLRVSSTDSATALPAGSVAAPTARHLHGV
jgi:hypothetical protein